jgi:hypothetical protein
MMAENWEQLIAKAKPLVDYLHRDEYFDRGFSGDRSANLVISDPEVGIDFASNDSFDTFDEWQTVSDSPDVFPPEFEWKRWIDFNLRKNDYFGLREKNFNGADTKWTRGDGCLLIELMHRDVRILLNCYANDSFPEVWKSIQSAYLHDGFPCGWDGKLPAGKLVVYSNE